MTTSSAIAVDALRVIRGGNPVLHGVDIKVPAGSITGLLGPSGCGKTTLMRAIVGTQRIDSGTVTVLDLPAGSARLRRSVGYVTQAPSVYTDLTVGQNVRYFADIYGNSAGVRDALDAVGLTEFEARKTIDLSGGQRSRVSIACALVASPELLILDEPTVGLDPLLREDLWNRFHDLAASGTTLLVSSHVMDEADRCDNLILMRDGLILAALTPDELRSRTGQDNLEKAFLQLITEDAA
ncbi:MAG: multidrug ABC transporter ATP-binding protein [Gordonia sp.]|uniref:ABC transporter ATP-binding protein n=1 Tax=Gordonia rubripertincta TaxID=36822 RepID=A0ABT4MQM5_GORRU|nr:ABC transporter ATP-binding protein [Gordonia rubripertincta]MBA4023986.1 multidrug ABC transporter ATP-binding protein [Gordonia sp. (in: high G+C Gram-positive bacteria)]MCZ4549287.1 ABC transporter ATP-binding protein [Gordonia rubripertincta]